VFDSIVLFSSVTLQRAQEEGEEARPEERPNGHRNGQSLSDGVLFGRLGVAPVDPTSFHSAGVGAGSRKGDGSGGSGGSGGTGTGTGTDRERRHFAVDGGRVSIAPGQTARIPLEITMDDAGGALPYLPCRDLPVSVEVSLAHFHYNSRYYSPYS